MMKTALLCLNLVLLVLLFACFVLYSRTDAEVQVLRSELRLRNVQLYNSLRSPEISAPAPVPDAEDACVISSLVAALDSAKAELAAGTSAKEQNHFSGYGRGKEHYAAAGEFFAQAGELVGQLKNGLGNVEKTRYYSEFGWYLFKVKNDCWGAGKCLQQGLALSPDNAKLNIKMAMLELESSYRSTRDRAILVPHKARLLALADRNCTDPCLYWVLHNLCLQLGEKYPNIGFYSQKAAANSANWDAEYYLYDPEEVASSIKICQDFADNYLKWQEQVKYSNQPKPESDTILDAVSRKLIDTLPGS